MTVHQSHLKDQLKTLLRDQPAKKRIRYEIIYNYYYYYCYYYYYYYYCIVHSFFNIIAFSTDVASWQTSLVPNTSRHKSEAEGWIQKLIFGGCSNLDEAITVCYLNTNRPYYTKTIILPYSVH